MANARLLTRWTSELGDAPCSPLEFYQLVQAEIMERELEHVTFSFVTRREGGVLSPQRTYLRVRLGKLFFDICAFLVGNAFVISYWLHEDTNSLFDLLTELPVLGFFLTRIFYAKTYYLVDYIQYSQQTIHQSILQVIDDLAEENDLTFLPEEVRQAVVWED